VRNIIMKKATLYLLLAGAGLGLSTGHAGVLQGLEMDVMDADETAAQATSRIALPQAGAVVEEGSPDYAGLVTDQALVGGERGEAAAVDYGNDGAPAAPTDDPGRGIDVGEPGVIDPGSLDDGGVSGEEPPDIGVIDPDPGIGVDEPIEEPVGDPVDGTPVGDASDGNGSEPGVMPPVETDGRVPE
jgi:hypothetical protein